MRIAGLHIDRFGIWSDLKMDNMPEGMTVFFGPNEAGKSTLMQYVRTMLYGFHPQRCARFVAEKRKNGTLIQPDGRLGGSLFVAARDGEYHIRRYANETDPLGDPGEVRVTSQDGQRHGAQRLSTLLAGIDDTIFHNVFAVGLQEMQAIGALDDTEAARQLFSLSTGADRVSLVDITRQLQATICRLVGCDDRDSLLAEIVGKQRRLQTQIDELATQTERWSSLVAERDALEDEIARLESVTEESSHRADVVELALRVQPKWEEVRRLGRQLESLGPVNDISQEVRELVQSLKADGEVHQQRFDGIVNRRQELQAQSDSLVISDALQRHSARITALLEQRSTIVALDKRVAGLKSEVDEAEFEIHAEQDRLGLANALSDEPKSEGARSEYLPRLDPAAIVALQQPALSLERERELLESAKREATSHREDASRIAREMAIALGREPDSFEKEEREDIRVALEETNGIAAGIRRLVKIDEEAGTLERRLQEIENRRADVLRSQLLPWDVVRALGALFAIGAVLFLCGVFGQSFGWSEQARGLLLFLGFVTGGLAGLLKLALDSPSRDGLRDADQQGDLLKKQLEDLQEERKRLDEKTPTRKLGAVNLSDTRRELVRLEALMPLEQQRRDILSMAEQAERRAIKIARSMKDSRRKWEDSLRSIGLSTKLTPAQWKALSGQSGSLGKLHGVLEERQRELQHAIREQSIVGDRVRDILADVMLRPADEKPSEQLNQLATALQLQEEVQEKRELIRNEDRQLKRDQQNELRVVKQLNRRRDSQIASTGAMDESDLTRMEQRAESRVKLDEQRKQLQREIDAMLADDRHEKLIQGELRKDAAGNLASRLERVQEESKQATSRLKQLQYRQGEIDEQIRQMATDRRSGEAHLEMGLLQHQLDDGVRKWQIVSAISGMLKTVYKKYEKERQPDALKEASQYLERMTSGRYARIWTPLAEDILLVDDVDGRSFPVEMLSRGTREQLFLSLRLALITGFSRRGIKMPLVLDDVLVNFDLDRTEAAALVLVDFARSGHQVLVFTCHQHIREIFQQLQVDVRDLPVQGHTSAKKKQIDSAPADAGDADEQSQRKQKRKRRPAVVLGFSESQYAKIGDGVSGLGGLQSALPPLPSPVANDSTLLGFWESPGSIESYDYLGADDEQYDGGPDLPWNPEATVDSPAIHEHWVPDRWTPNREYSSGPGEQYESDPGDDFPFEPRNDWEDFSPENDADYDDDYPEETVELPVGDGEYGDESTVSEADLDELDDFDGDVGETYRQTSRSGLRYDSAHSQVGKEKPRRRLERSVSRYEKLKQTAVPAVGERDSDREEPAIDTAAAGSIIETLRPTSLPEEPLAESLSTVDPPRISTDDGHRSIQGSTRDREASDDTGETIRSESTGKVAGAGVDRKDPRLASVDKTQRLGGSLPILAGLTDSIVQLPETDRTSRSPLMENPGATETKPEVIQKVSEEPEMDQLSQDAIGNAMQADDEQPIPVDEQLVTAEVSGTENEDEYEYEYVEVDVDEDGNEIAETDDEDEYEYVEVDEDSEVSEGKDKDKDKVEVEVEDEEENADEEGNADEEYEYVEVAESEAAAEGETAAKEEEAAAEEEDEYEYEYVEVDEDEEESDEYEYEYVEVDEDESESADSPEVVVDDEPEENEAEAA